MQKIFCITFLTLFFLFQLTAQVCLDTHVRESDIPEEILVDVIADNFEDIISAQYSLRYDPSLYEFIALDNTNLPDFTEVSFNANVANIPGAILTAWLDFTTLGFTLDSESALVTFRFKKLTSVDGPFTISNEPISVEIADIDSGPLEVRSCNSGEFLVAFIDVRFTLDENENCSRDDDEVTSSQNFNWSGWQVRATQNGNSYYSLGTHEAGLSSIQLFPGINEIVITPPSPYYALCNNSFTINTDDITLDEVIEVYANITEFCPLMTVDVFNPIVNACDTSIIFVDYQNLGTTTAENAYLELLLDERLTLLDNEELTFSELENGVLRFEIGDLPIGERSSFLVRTSLDCEVVEGESICAEARVFPNEFCGESNPNWSGASLKVEGFCNGEEVIFEIENVGEGDMQEASEFVVIEDNLVFKSQPIQLAQGEKETIRIAANGATYRLQIEQEMGHPGESRPTVFVEGCGRDENGEFSKGFAQFFPNDEADLFVAIDCRQANVRFSEILMRAFPQGFGEERLVEATDFLEYQIFFGRNSEQVIILDTLSSMLDISTFQPGTGSHPYWYQISEAGVAQFIIPPPTTFSLDQNFINFKIKPKAAIPMGTEIRNSASIYKGLRTPSATNDVFHTIGENFLQRTTSTNTPLFQPSALLSVTPNPARENVYFSLEEPPKNLYQLTIYNNAGQCIERTVFNNQVHEWHNNNLPAGIYFYRLSQEYQSVASGSFVIID